MGLGSSKEKLFQMRGMATCLLIDRNNAPEGKADNGAYSPEKRELTATKRHKNIHSHFIHNS